MQHPAILEAAVIGKTDSDGLTKTKAFVVLKPGQVLDEDSVKSFCKEHLAPYKYPRYIEFVNELPKTATGKIQRFKLREQEAARTWRQTDKLLPAGRAAGSKPLRLLRRGSFAAERAQKHRSACKLQTPPASVGYRAPQATNQSGWR